MYKSHENNTRKIFSNLLVYSADIREYGCINNILPIQANSNHIMGLQQKSKTTNKILDNHLNLFMMRVKEFIRMGDFESMLKLVESNIPRVYL